MGGILGRAQRVDELAIYFQLRNADSSRNAALFRFKLQFQCTLNHLISILGTEYVVSFEIYARSTTGSLLGSY